MRKAQAKQATEAVKNKHPPQLNIEITPQFLKLLKSNDEFRKTDMITVAKHLERKHKFPDNEKLHVIQEEKDLKTFLQSPTKTSNIPHFIIYGNADNHWVCFCLVNFEDSSFVLYKNSHGGLCSIDALREFSERSNIDIINHLKREQDNEYSSGAMALKNIEILIEGLKKKKFIDNFHNTRFCSKKEVQPYKDQLRAEMQIYFTQTLTGSLLKLMADDEYPEFHEILIGFLDQTYNDFKDIADGSENESNESKKKRLQESLFVKKLLEMQKNSSVGGIQDFSMSGDEKNKNTQFQPQIMTQFPKQYEQFINIFDLIRGTKPGPHQTEALRIICENLKINFERILFFFKQQSETSKDAVNTAPSSNPETFSSAPMEEVDNPKISHLITPRLPDPEIKTLDDVLLEMGPESNEKLKLQFKEIEAFYEKWKNKTANDIIRWSQQNRGQLSKTSVEVIAIMDKANELVTHGHRLRIPQIIALLVFLQAKENSGKLCQIIAGEGKTIVVAIFAAIKVLQGEGPVDVITSNPVLAQDGVDTNSEFYLYFGITTATNNVDPDSEAPEGERSCYKVDVLYGSIGNFQFDFLKHSFVGLETRGDRPFGIVLLDEVDSMLIDNGGHIAKLAAPCPGMESLRYIYIKIWIELQKAQNDLPNEFKKQLEEKHNQLKAQLEDETISVETANALFEKYQIQFFDNSQKTLKDKVMASSPLSIDLIPKYLKKFAENTLERWVDNAIYAKYGCHENHHYTIKLKDKEKVVIPVDFANTGVSMINTIWSYGLHQFIQLKHNLRLTTESLTSCCISNFGYIHKYGNKLYGLTGTLGSTAEQNLLSSIYPVEFTIIPTFKPKKFEEIPGIVTKDKEWDVIVTMEAARMVEAGRAVLIICKTLSDATLVENCLNIFPKDSGIKFVIKKFQDETDSAVTHDDLQPGDIIIATNIAGRGTDFKTASQLEENGGLHVCVSFCPGNERVKEQAFFRTSRKGLKGSAQLIIRESEVRELGIKTERLKDIDFELLKFAIDVAEESRLDVIINNKLDELNFMDSLSDLFSDLHKTFVESNSEKCVRTYVAKDLKEFWSFWIEEQKLVDKKFSAEAAQQLFDKFKTNPTTIAIMNGHISHNPYYGVQQADYFIKNDKLDEARKTLENSIKINGIPGTLYSAYFKLFEIEIEGGKALFKKFQDVIAKVLIFGHFIDVKNDEYKKKAEQHLQNAYSAISKEIDYLNFVLSEESGLNSVIIPVEKDETNVFIKHFISRLYCLQYYRSNVEGLQEELKNIKSDGLFIDGRSTGFIQNLIPETDGEKLLKESTTDIELNELESIGLDTTYSIQKVHGIPTPVLAVAQAEILSGLAMWVAAAFFPLALVFVAPAASFLINEGIITIVMEIMGFQNTSEYNKHNHITNKIVSYGIGLITFGLSAFKTVKTIFSKVVSKLRKISDFLRKSKIMNFILNGISKAYQWIHKGISYIFSVAASNTVTSFTLKTIIIGSVKNAVKTACIDLVLKSIISPACGLLRPGIERIIERTISNSKHLNKTSVMDKFAAIEKGQILLISQNVLNSESVALINMNVAKQISLGVAASQNNWKIRLAGFVVDTLIDNTQIVTYPNTFCKEMGGKLEMVEITEKKADLHDDCAIDSIKIDISKLVSNKMILLIESMSLKVATKTVNFAIQKIQEKINQSTKLATQNTQNHDEDAESYYKELGLKPGATKEEIRKAATKLLYKYNPNTNKDPDAHHKYAKVIEARKFLNNHVTSQSNTQNDRFEKASKSTKQTTDDYYETLGLKPGATKEEMNKAKIKLWIKYHPDRNKDADAAYMFSKVTVAYEKFLSHHETTPIQSFTGNTNPQSTPMKMLPAPDGTKISSDPTPSSFKVPPEIHPQAPHMLRLPAPDGTKISSDHTLPSTSFKLSPEINPQPTPMLMLPAPSKTLPSTSFKPPPETNPYQIVVAEKTLSLDQYYVNNQYILDLLLQDFASRPKDNDCVMESLATVFENVNARQIEKTSGVMNIGNGFTIEDTERIFEILELDANKVSLAATDFEKNLNKHLLHIQSDAALVFAMSENQPVGHCVAITQTTDGSFTVSDGGEIMTLEKYLNSSSTYIVLSPKNLKAHRLALQTTIKQDIPYPYGFKFSGQENKHDLYGKAPNLKIKKNALPYHKLENHLENFDTLKRAEKGSHLERAVELLADKLDDISEKIRSTKKTGCGNRNFKPMLATGKLYNASSLDLGIAFVDIEMKQEMMLGALEIKYTNGTKLSLVAVSGDELQTKHSYENMKHETSNPSNLSVGQFQFVDFPAVEKAKMKNLYDRSSKNFNLTKSCAAQKLLYGADQHLKENPGLVVDQMIIFEQFWVYKHAEGQTNQKNQPTRGQGCAAPCKDCKEALSHIIDKNMY